MIINNAPVNEATVSNVNEIGEFRIRNSAKAFSILSSGLYANKIRAIIRELSCNAVDSHVAAGKQDTPFDVHLPNSLEPYFSIRDYGTGLSHDQVTNIYTTYFESTKTNSNEFIGALGLGSKSPFSYTDNFTVTAVRDGRKGIYTAFINEQGVPSIALMMEEQTTDPAGVEVRFSVNDRYDFSKFKDEARSVYKWFKQRPVVTGVTSLDINEVTYETENIIPGVSVMDNTCGGRSYAVMGNISYPIEIPNAEDLGDLRNLLNCGLVMEFDIGELDFQASREGLSYIPQTIASIKTKLASVVNELTKRLASDADQITNNWEKALFLAKKSNTALWNPAVSEYIVTTGFKYCQPGRSYHGSNVHNFKLYETELATDFNIKIRKFTKSRNYNVCYNDTPESEIGINGPAKKYFACHLSHDTRFVVNDTKIGATERAKYHVKNSSYMKDANISQVKMFVIEQVDKTKPIKLNEFKALLANPPESHFTNASDLLETARASGLAKNVTIMKLEQRDSNGWRRSSSDMVWRDAGKASSFDTKTTYYYIPLSGFQALNKCSDVKALSKYVATAGVHKGAIFGVRKGDIEFIKTQKNWVELDTLIVDKLGKLDKNHIMGSVKQHLDINELIKYNSDQINKNSPFVKLVNAFIDIPSVDSGVEHAIQYLSRVYDVTTSNSPQKLIDKYVKENTEVRNRYPLLKSLNYSADKAAVAEYINLVDQAKGV